MKISYTGRQVELAPAQLRKLQSHFSKIGKLLDGKSECEAHVILSVERHLQRAEATVNYFGHQLVGMGEGVDLFTAIHSAAAKLEKQAVKARTKWRDTRRAPHKSASETETEALPPESEAAEPEEPGAERRIFRVNQHHKRKPITLEEAILEMEKKRDYLVYRDAQTDKVSVLLRRRDGNFDLVEG